MDELAGRVAVITGGASGIGLAMAGRFGAEGMRVVIGDIEPAALDTAVAGLVDSGVEAIGVVTDVSDPEAMQHLADETERVFGGWHVVCLNAGVGSGGPIWEQDLADWQWVLGVNLWGVVHGVQTFVPAMVERGEGHVVLTASLAGLFAGPRTGPYNASKFAVVAIGETLHADLADAGSGVGVSILCPAWVNTRIFESHRNRPDELSGQGDPGDDLVAQMGAFFATSMPPAEVADQVFDAVRERRLHILTHDFSADAIRARTAQILGE